MIHCFLAQGAGRRGNGTRPLLSLLLLVGSRRLWRHDDAFEWQLEREPSCYMDTIVEAGELANLRLSRSPRQNRIN